MLPFILIAIALGVATEAVARVGGLWRYRNPWLPVANVVLVFGFVYGGITFALAGRWAWLFVAGAAVGLAYEIANDRVLKAWTFTAERVPWLRGQVAVIGVGIAWGFVPLFITALHGVIP